MTKASHNDSPILKALIPPLFLSLAMWIVYKADTIYSLELYKYGVFPRNWSGLTGILFTPMIHSTENMYHIFENTIALLFFGTLLFYFYRKIAWKTIISGWLLTHGLVWLLAAPVYHVGMSGEIYAIAFFLLTGSVIRKNRQLTGVTFLIIFLYGSIFWGLFPLIPSVSWESHAFGALAGIVIGIYYRKTIPSQVFIEPPLTDDPADDAEDAWWKTGVIKEKTDEPEIHYYYTPPNKDKT